MNEENNKYESWGVSPLEISPHRFHLNDERKSVTVEFTIYPSTEDEPDSPPPSPVKGKFIVGLFPNGSPGELFVKVDKEGSEVHGWADCWAISVSMLLQFGINPEKIYDKFKYQDFKPKGISNLKTVPICKSIIDMIMKYMEKNFYPTAKKEIDEYDTMIESIVEDK